MEIERSIQPIPLTKEEALAQLSKGQIVEILFDEDRWRENAPTLQAIRPLLEAYPDAVKARDCASRAFLHIAASNGAPRDLTQYVTSLWPGAIKERSLWGSKLLPVHLACGSGKTTSIESAKFLLEQWPESIKEPDGDGDLPVHHAVKRKTGALELTKYLVDQWPDSIKHKSHRFSTTPLIAALWSGECGPELIKYLVEQWPDSVKEKSDGRINGYVLPLHHALDKREVHAEVIRVLVDQWPDSVKERTNMGTPPLEQAIAMGADADVAVIKVLVEAWPDSVKVEDSVKCIPPSKGCCALWQAIKTKAPLPVIQYLIKQWPDALKIRTSFNGDLPLHTAVRHGSPVEVIQCMVQHWPDSIKEKNDKGEIPLLSAIHLKDKSTLEIMDCLVDPRCPLHFASGYQGALPYIQAHMAENSNSIRDLDDQGNLPLHSALSRVAELEVIKYLTDRWPESVKERNRNGDLPLHLAIIHQAGLKVIQYLVKQWPDSVTEKDHHGCISWQVGGASNAPVEVIEYLVALTPDTVKNEQ